MIRCNEHLQVKLFGLKGRRMCNAQICKYNQLSLLNVACICMNSGLTTRLDNQLWDSSQQVSDSSSLSIISCLNYLSRGRAPWNSPLHDSLSVGVAISQVLFKHSYWGIMYVTSLSFTGDVAPEKTFLSLDSCNQSFCLFLHVVLWSLELCIKTSRVML